MSVPGQFVALAPKFTHDKKGSSAIKSSNFLITFNTNVRFAPDDRALDELSLPLYNMAECIFGDGEKLAKVVDYGLPGARVGGKTPFIKDPNIVWGLDTMVDYKVTAGVEIGHNARGQRLHMHVVVKLRHKSYVRLNKDAILEHANRYLKEVGFQYPIKHMNIKVTPPSAEDYLDK
jgi:hypothetical protein